MEIIDESNNKTNTETTGSVNINNDPLQTQKETIEKELKTKKFFRRCQKDISGFVENFGLYNSDKHRREIM